MAGFCFTIPCYVHEPKQLHLVQRCVQSIQRVYPTTPIYIIHTKSACVPHLEITGATVIENPYPGSSMFGAMYVFYTQNLANATFVIHDSMVIYRKIDEPLYETADFRSIFYFEHTYFPELFTDRYIQWIRQCNITNQEKEEANHDLTHNIGKTWVANFGPSFYITRQGVERLHQYCNILDQMTSFSTRDSICSMEVLLGFFAFKTGLLTSIQDCSICGELFTMQRSFDVHQGHLSLEQVLQIPYPYPIYKSYVGRLGQSS
jgi:hypothetical protein